MQLAAVPRVLDARRPLQGNDGFSRGRLLHGVVAVRRPGVARRLRRPSVGHTDAAALPFDTGVWWIVLVGPVMRYREFRVDGPLGAFARPAVHFFRSYASLIRDIFKPGSFDSSVAHSFPSFRFSPSPQSRVSMPLLVTCCSSSRLSH